MDNLFNENMTFLEAEHAFFAAIDGKPKKDAIKIRKQLEQVMPAITKNEIERGAKGWL